MSTDPKTLRDLYDIATITDKSRVIPDFRGAVFELAPNLGYTCVVDVPLHKEDTKDSIWARLIQKDKFLLSSRTYDEHAAAKLRRLQELAQDGHHHLAEKRFFRAELLARRGNESKRFFERSIIQAFDTLSKCGLNFWRPFWGLIGMSILFASLYFYWSDVVEFSYKDLGHLINYTLARDVITDFEVGTDILVLTNTRTDFRNAADVRSASRAATVDGETGVLINTGSGTIFLEGLTLSQISSLDYMF